MVSMVLCFIVTIIVAVESSPVEDKEHAAQCPSGTTQCGEGCCPLPSAVCCSDGVHCCPNGYTCNYAVGGCTRNQLFSPFLEKEKFIQKSMAAGCPSGMTQCGSGCCPLPSAICCSDGVHCCPNGYTCNYAAGGCTRSQLSAPFVTKITIKSESQAARCPSGTTQCGSGCCPLPSAVCCSDGVHCCPNGYTCNYAAGGCTRGQMSSPFVQKIAIKSETQAAGCPSGMTQCGAGCCPLPSAVCCSDGVHCCPNGYTCNYAVGGCTRNQMSSPFVQKIAIKSETQAAGCPSGMTQCGSGCCPLPSAVCCSDGVHCCPNGYKCNYAAGGCTRSQMFSPFLEKRMF